MVNALPHSPHSTRYVITHHVQIVFPLFTTSISLLTMSPCVSFHVFHSTCLLVSPSNVSFQCLLVSLSNVCNASFHVSSNDQCVLSSLVQFISNTSIHASSNQSPTHPSRCPPIICLIPI